MGIGESLLLGAIGMTIVFAVLIVLNVMIKVLSVTVNAIKKKPIEG